LEQGRGWALERGEVGIRPEIRESIANSIMELGNTGNLYRFSLKFSF
jgi:hypothetical protein